MIEGKNILFTYHHPDSERAVLDHVSFQIPDGQIVGLFGENGTGKSTLMRIMAGVLTFAWGETDLTLDGVPVRKQRGEVACIFEEGTFLPELPPRKYGQFLADFFPNFDMDYYEKLLTFFRLEEKAPRKMSRGQRAKLEIAAGLAKRTKYILMDEPFLGKDALVRQDFLKILSGSLTGEETLVIVTHELELMENFIDRAMVLHEGRFAADVLMDDLHREGKNLVSLMKDTVDYDERAYLALFDEEE